MLSALSLAARHVPGRFYSPSYHLSRRLLHIVFFGSDDFSVPHLRALSTLHSHDITVVTGSPRTPIAQLAGQLGHPVIHWYALQHSEEIAFPAAFDVGVVASFGHFLPSWLVQRARQCMMNIHPSLLPRWRGAAPIVYTILKGDKETGVTAIRIHPEATKFDVGSVLLQRRYQPGLSLTTVTRSQLTRELANLGASMLLEVLADLSSHAQQAKPQSALTADGGSSLSRKVTPAMGYLDWSQLSIGQLDRLTRAIDELVPLVCCLGNPAPVLGIRLLDPIPQSEVNMVLHSQQKLAAFLKTDESPPGTVRVSRLQPDWLLIRCRDGWCAFGRVIVGSLDNVNERRRNLTPIDFSNGYLRKERFRNACFVPLGDNPLLRSLK